MVEYRDISSYLDPSYLRKQVKCAYACPANTDARAYIEAISRGDFDTAYAINLRDNLFPGVLGRTCTAPCEGEGGCRRAHWDSPVAIRALKWAAAEYRTGNWRRLLPDPPPRNGLSVGIVGAGPAGLATARDLVLLGYEVHIYEALPFAGGLMVSAIPRFRLPLDVVEEEVGYVLELGVRLHTRVDIGKDATLEDLLGEHEAVVVATGTQKPQSLRVVGEELPEVKAGLHFMYEVCLSPLLLHEPVRALGLTSRGLGVQGKRVAVIGGGFTAFDVARSAIRLGAREVTVVYRRTRREMLATPEEVAAAEEEGVSILELASPIGIEKREGKLVLVAVRNRLGAPDATGRPRPEPVEGTEFEIEADMVVPAISQFPEPRLVGSAGAELDPRGWWQTDPVTGMTSRPGVFAAGDFALGPTDIITAVAHGRRVARGVHRFLQGREPRERPFTARILRKYEKDLSDYELPRHQVRMVPVGSRDMETSVEMPMSREEALAEGRRCYLCNIQVTPTSNPCVACNACVDVCPPHTIEVVAVDEAGRPLTHPELVPARALQREGHPLASRGRVGGDHEHLLPANVSAARVAILIDDEYCLRCGLCAARCPTATLSMTAFEEEGGWPEP